MGGKIEKKNSNEAKMNVLSHFYVAVLVLLRINLSALADKCVKGLLAMQCFLMYANCVKGDINYCWQCAHAVHLFMRLVNLLIV